MVLSRARGPFLAMLLGLAVANFVLLGRRRAWKAVTVSAAAAAALVLVLVLVNLPHSPLAPLATRTVFGRLTQLSNVKPGSPVWFRLRVWNGIASGWTDQLRGREVIPGTSPPVRSVLGYGLETQLLTLGQLALPLLGDARARTQEWHAQYLVDRAHNTLLDHLVTGVAQCLTIIGIPLGLANFKLIPVSLLPLGREIVSVDQARAAGLGAEAWIG